MFNRDKRNSTQNTMRYERDYRNYECYRPKISVDNDQSYSNDSDRNNNSNINHSNNSNNYPNTRRVGNEYDNLAYGSSRDMYYQRIEEERAYRGQNVQQNNGYNQGDYNRNQNVNASRNFENDYNNQYSRPNNDRNIGLDNGAINTADKSRRVAQNQSTANTYGYVGGNRNNYDSEMNNNNRAYNRPEYAAFNEAPKKAKREGMSGKTKALVIVYACIAILVIALVIVNCLPNASAQSPKTETQVQDVQFGEGATSSVVGNDGKATNIVIAPSGSEYKYDTDTNWFDKMCDWIENLVG